MARMMTGVSDASGTAARLSALRQAMAAHGLDAYLIPSVDEHINEYLPDNKQRRAWASGFTGSAGDFLVGLEEAWVFADARYHEQVDAEVDPDCIRVSKLGLDGQPSLIEKIKHLSESEDGNRLTGKAGRREFKLGFDPFTLTVQQQQAFQKAFVATGVILRPVAGNLVDPLWTDAPADVHSAVYGVPDAVAGNSVSRKLGALRERMKTSKTDILPLTKLDQIAWLFNLRGQDIPYNPVFTAYAIITPEQALLFTEASRLRPVDREALSSQVAVLPYGAYADKLKALSTGRNVLIDPKHTTVGTWELVSEAGGVIREAEHPVELLKANKNPVEIAGMREANLRASRGKIRAWAWLEKEIAEGKTVTEVGFKEAIEAFYAEEEGFAGLSFNTISGAGSNSSIVHYGMPDPKQQLKPGELFLIDSGCQFLGKDFMGTTDDTRTLLVGAGETATELQKLRYTEVLKAHINCAMQRFPKGTEGTRLDGVTRSTLWQNGLDYGHGTGHGVGAFLNVHEGPNGIHKLAAKPLEPGMINSIEPGYYQPGWGGIRLENLYVVVDHGPDESGVRWYGFESLTYVPFDKKLINASRLDAAQLAWLRTYHQAVLDRIGPSLSREDQAWLASICATK